MENNSIKEILVIANKIIKSSLLKESEILFLSYSARETFELLIKPMTTYSDFIQHCILKNIKSSIIIIKYKNIKDFNKNIESVKNFYEYVKIFNIEITDFFILKKNIFRKITREFIESKN